MSSLCAAFTANEDPFSIFPFTGFPRHLQKKEVGEPQNSRSVELSRCNQRSSEEYECLLEGHAWSPCSPGTSKSLQYHFSYPPSCVIPSFRLTKEMFSGRYINQVRSKAEYSKKRPLSSKLVSYKDYSASSCTVKVFSEPLYHPVALSSPSSHQLVLARLPLNACRAMSKRAAIAEVSLLSSFLNARKNCGGGDAESLFSDAPLQSRFDINEGAVYWPAKVVSIRGELKGELFGSSYHSLSLLQDEEDWLAVEQIARRSPMEIVVSVVFTVDEATEGYALSIYPKWINEKDSEAFGFDVPVLDTLPSVLSAWNYSFEAIPSPTERTASMNDPLGVLKRGTLLSMKSIKSDDMLAGPICQTQSIAFLQPTVDAIQRCREEALTRLRTRWNTLRSPRVLKLPLMQELSSRTAKMESFCVPSEILPEPPKPSHDDQNLVSQSVPRLQSSAIKGVYVPVIMVQQSPSKGTDFNQKEKHLLALSSTAKSHPPQQELALKPSYQSVTSSTAGRANSLHGSGAALSASQPHASLRPSALPAKLKEGPPPAAVSAVPSPLRSAPLVPQRKEDDPRPFYSRKNDSPKRFQAEPGGLQPAQCASAASLRGHRVEEGVTRKASLHIALSEHKVDATPAKPAQNFHAADSLESTIRADSHQKTSSLFTHTPVGVTSNEFQGWSPTVHGAFSRGASPLPFPSGAVHGVGSDDYPEGTSPFTRYVRTTFKSSRSRSVQEGRSANNIPSSRESRDHSSCSHHSSLSKDSDQGEQTPNIGRSNFTKPIAGPGGASALHPAVVKSAPPKASANGLTSLRLSHSRK